MIASIILNLLVFVQSGPCAGCSGGPGPCLPCCSATPPCGGGPPPPPGLSIDSYIYFFFMLAIIYGVYALNRKKTKI